MDHDDEELDGLPDDFNIDWTIARIEDTVLTRIPLSIQFYHLIMRLENQKTVKDGRMYLHLFLCNYVIVCILSSLIDCHETTVSLKTCR